MDWALLAGVAEDDVQRLLTASRRRKFAKGEVVFHRGDPADTLHLIRKGRFGVRIVTPLGDSATLTVLGPGEFFGDLALLSPEGIRSATVGALEPAETLAVHRLDLDRVKQANPDVSEVLLAVLGAVVRRLSEQLVEALYLPAEDRVLRRLDDVAARYGSGPGDVLVPLTQEDIASLAGTSRATVNRVLREQERLGVIALRRGGTVVLDRGALARNSGR